MIVWIVTTIAISDTRATVKACSLLLNDIIWKKVIATQYLMLFFECRRQLKY